MKHQKKYGKRSQIGIAFNGRKERPARTEKALTNAERQPVSPLPREMSAKILGNPKNKLTAEGRKRVLRSRELMVNLGVNLAKPLKDRITAQVGKWSMGQLVRLVTKYKHRMLRASSILEDLSPDSRFAPKIRHFFYVHSFTLSAVKSEIERRTEAPAVRDTRTPRIRKWDAIKATLSQTN